MTPSLINPNPYGVRPGQEEEGRLDRQNKEGEVIWITGLSGAGKSSIAREVVRLLRKEQRPVAFLDGDEIRAAIADPHVGYDRESRLANAMRICRFARIFSGQGLTVVVATMSLFGEVYEWNRRFLPHYFEIYSRVSCQTLKKRNPNGLISRMERGEVRQVVGGDLDYDEPKASHMIVDNDEDLGSFGEIASRVLHQFEGR